MLILLDMDELLADFEGGAARAFGWTREELRRARPPGQWHIEELLAPSRTQFWKHITALGEQFWLDLEPLPWLNELVRLVSDFADEWYVVTAPSMCPTCYSAKVKWLRRVFGAQFNHFIITAHKHLLAAPGRVLIDDREETVYGFEALEGHGILFPAYGNRLHVHHADPLTIVQEQLGLFSRR